MNRNMIGAIAALIGTIIGAGVLGIPYTFAKSGILLGLCNLIFVGGVVLLMNLMLGEVTLRTHKSRMLPKLAERFLGKAGKNIMLISLFAVIWGAMIAYLIGVGDSLAAIAGVNNILGFNASLIFSLIFFVMAALLVYLGLRAVTRGEMILAGTTVIVILVLCMFCFSKASFSNLSLVKWSGLFLPYGVILFATHGTETIPEMRRVLEKHKKLLKHAIMIGTLIPIILYALFAVLTVSVTGLATTEIATIGLGNSLGAVAILLGNLFAIFAMASSFIILGLSLKDSLTDSFLKMRHWQAFALTVIAPLIVFLLGVKSFVTVINITGTLACGIGGILVALIWRAARRKGNRKPEYTIKWSLASYLLIIMFSLGIVYTFLNIFGVL